jgi:NadR type nicotinamide-nucleotide adenylyltransferase
MKKIVTIGPESTGKSSLCSQLAEHYSTVWCPEYAREYLLSHGMNYTYDNLLTIAKEQIALEDNYLQRMTHDARIIFIDTDMYVMKVWCEFVFGKCHQWILDRIRQRKYDLYLLCNIDLPWVRDELREYPDIERRQQLYNIYRSLMQKQSTPWVEISGNSEERFAKAVAAVDDLMKK